MWPSPQMECGQPERNPSVLASVSKCMSQKLLISSQSLRHVEKLLSSVSEEGKKKIARMSRISHSHRTKPEQPTDT